MVEWVVTKKLKVSFRFIFPLFYLFAQLSFIISFAENGYTQQKEKEKKFE